MFVLPTVKKRVCQGAHLGAVPMDSVIDRFVGSKTVENLYLDHLYG
jgi:hypothetical protein